MFETHLTVVGTLITAVDRRRLPDGTAVANFRIASNERRFDREKETWSDGDSLYVSVTCWRQLAENVHATFAVGDPIIVRGRLHTRSYEDKDGKRQSVTALEGLAVGPDLTRAMARLVRLRRDGTPVGVAPRGSEAPGEPEEAGLTDDPWASGSTADGRPDEFDSTADRCDTAIEAPVGA